MTDTGSSSPESDDIHRWLSVRVQTLAWELNRQMAVLVRDYFGLTMPEWRIIANLAATGGATVQTLATMAGMDKAQVSRTVTALTMSRHVKRESDPNDRRSMLLHLTDDGWAIFRQIEPISRARREWLSALVEPSDLDTFVRVADTLIDALRDAPALEPALGASGGKTDETT